MDTFANIIQAVQDDFTIGDESLLFTPTIVKRAINRAYRKVGAAFRWPALEDAKKTTTTASQEYYDYPAGWRSDSIWKLKVNSVRYGEEPDGSPLSFDDYLNWREDYSDSTDKKWANQQRRYFISPVPTASALEICVWGQMVTETLSSDSDTTIFSYSEFECNEAIELEAVAILKNKEENEKAGSFRSLEAKQILGFAWSKISKEQAKYEKNMPFFNVPDFYGHGTTEDLRGKFNTRV